mmetsp:Transcript_176793/g.567050  ORF Transcript_176793/g.567050 Transcript_176793/m.567050 type:complete len:702 (-) Transcript_176793:157-2262(-)
MDEEPEQPPAKVEEDKEEADGAVVEETTAPQAGKKGKSKKNASNKNSVDQAAEREQEGLVAERKAAERRARQEAKQEAERKARELEAMVERRAKEEAERKAAQDAAKRQARAEQKAKQEVERKAKEEADRQLDAEKKAKEANQAAERKAKQESQKKPKLEAEKRAKPAKEGATDDGDKEAEATPAKKFAKSWADLAANREPKADDEDDLPKGSTWNSKPMAADAPEFVPFFAQGAQDNDAVGLNGEDFTLAKQQDLSSMGGVPITTMVISGIPAHHTSESFREQLDAWGLLGTYDFFFMPNDSEIMGDNYSFINFIDPTFATLCQFMFQQYSGEGSATPFHIQGLESNIVHWSQYATTENTMNAPLVIQSPSPSQWAINGANMMLNSKFSPQIREQFHKTKMCVFHKKNKCAMGSSCPFAHSKDELMAVPDLAKTKLCYNFFRRKCNDPRCKFAHGYQELRATDGVYKTEICRWWTFGSCKAGESCRYAHGVEELRVQPNNATMSMMMAASDMYGGMDFGEDAFAQEFQDYQDFHKFPMIHGMPSESGTNPQGTSSLAPGAWCRQASAASGMASRRSGGCGGSDGELSDDCGLSDVDTNLLGGLRGDRPRRQQTAPPAPLSMRFADVTEMRRKATERAIERAETEGSQDTVVLRVKGTFIESVQLDDVGPPPVPMRRSWSDGDLGQLMEVMEGMGDLDEEF